MNRKRLGELYISFCVGTMSAAIFMGILALFAFSLIRGWWKLEATVVAILLMLVLLSVAGHVLVYDRKKRSDI